MTLSLELEIKALLEEFRDPEIVAEKLIRLFEEHSDEWSEKSVKELSSFLLSCNLYQQLIAFCLKHLRSKKFVMPWPYFIQAVALGIPDLDEDVVKLIILGIEEEKAMEQASLGQGAERFIKKALQWKNEFKRKRRKYASEIKQKMLDELLTLRTQQLYEQEKIMLGKMQRMFPGDQDVIEELSLHKERYALDILSRRSSLGRRIHQVQDASSSPEVQAATDALKESLLEAVKIYPEMAFDFAIAAFMLDEPQISLALLETAELTLDQHWFYLEVKLKCRHFLEVLTALSALELQLAHEPETFFATAYLRAQAYWGLEQKYVAIEILETILEARPNYRASSTLLDLWRSQ
ncbi:MAG TPA: hypothetical protein VIG33_04350 [Pseudobdellovibrionaceae bacterium]